MNQQCFLLFFLHISSFDLLDNSINFVGPTRVKLTEIDYNADCQEQKKKLYVDYVIPNETTLLLVA